MQVDFLSADKPLAKQFSMVDGELKELSYPMVSNVTSTRCEWNSLVELLDLLTKHSAQGHCLLKGLLGRQITNQSRRGLTTPNAPTRFIVLDNDFSEGFDSVDHILRSLDPVLGATSYILHHSSSAGIKYPKGLRSHVFIKLEREVPAQLLKQWLIHLNLNTPELRNLITLNAAGLALRWPLDTTTCQNDKLIYISDPVCIDIEDPLAGQRFELIQRERETFEVPTTINAQKNADDTEELINNLRKEAGLKKRTAKYTRLHDDQILLNPDRATVTSTREQQDYVRVNLNGGDSWAYWHTKEDPVLLFNFKGEPIVRLEDIDPDYYESIKQQNTPAVDNKPIPLAFRNRETDTYYNAIFYPASGDLKLDEVGSTHRIRDFFKNFDMEGPPFIEDWEFEFRPTCTLSVDISRKWVNSFHPTEYMKNPGIAPPAAPATIQKLIRHVTGNDDEFYDWFINWVAYIFQTRLKTGTAVVLHGTQGTGKGQLFNRILRPIFGPEHTMEVVTTRFDDKFNGDFETNLICFVDEANVEDTISSKRTMNMLKNQITEPHLVIRAMRRNPVTRANHSNYIFGSNTQAPIEITEEDRRFCVAPRQENKLEITDDELQLINHELQMFAGYLNAYKVNTTKVRTVLHNAAREELIRINTNSIQSFFKAVNEGNLEFFAQYLQKVMPITPGNTYLEFKKAVERWTASVGHQTVVPKEELHSTFMYLQSSNISPTKFARVCTLNGCNIGRYQLDGIRQKGVLVTFKAEPDVIQLVEDLTQQQKTG